MSEKKKLGEKTVDELLVEIERDLRRLDEKLEDHGQKFKKNVESFEEKFNKFMSEKDVDLGELKEKAGHEFDRLKEELDYAGVALRKSFETFRDQYRERDKDKKD